MSTIVSRVTKGSALTWAEADANFTNLNTDKYQSGDSPSFASVTVTAGTMTGLSNAYSNVLGLGVTPTAWSNTVLPVTAWQYGDRSAIYQYTGENCIGFNVKVNSSYQDVAITASGTPAKLKVGGGAITMQTAATNPGAGSAITFTTIARADGSYVSGGAFVVDVGRVAFPATQNASTDANILDDYEEGTWTPSLLFGGGNTGMTYATQLGRYVKVGKMVYCMLYFILSAKGSSTGAATVSGLPFTTVNNAARGGGNQSYQASMVGLVSSVALLPAQNGTTVSLFSLTTTGSTQLNDTNFGATGEIYAHFMYESAS